MKIVEFLHPQSVIADLTSHSKPDVLGELAGALVRSEPTHSSERVLEVLKDREKLGSTGIGDGVAIPHGKLPGAGNLIASFGVSRPGIDFEAIDGRPTQLFFALLARENSAGVHLKALARISRLFKNASFRQNILQAKTADEIYQLIAQEDSRS